MENVRNPPWRLGLCAIRKGPETAPENRRNADGRDWNRSGGPRHAGLGNGNVTGGGNAAATGRGDQGTSVTTVEPSFWFS